MSFKSILIVFIYFIVICNVMAIIKVVDVGILPLVENSVGIIFFVDITNEDRQNVYKVYSHCKKCCLIDSNQEDCDITTAFGDIIQTIKPRDRKTLLYVAPMLFQHDIVGHCKILIMYQSKNKKEEIDVKIPFDTQVSEKKSKKVLNQYIGTKKIKVCDSLDEDSLNNCEPVVCRIKYLDKRPIFDSVLNKCIETPICLTNPDKELPDNVYVPMSNTCRNLDLPLSVQDIYVINTGLGTVTMSYDSTPGIKVQVFSNCSTISQNIKLLRDLIYGKLCPMDAGVTLDYSKCFKSALWTIVLCIISICSFFFILVCCINCIAWLFIQWSDGNLSNVWKDLKNYFKGKEKVNTKTGKINSIVRNALLREVIVKDIPLELRNSVIDVCDRMGREVYTKKRYRSADIGSQISLQKIKKSPSSSMSSSTSLQNY